MSIPMHNVAVTARQLQEISGGTVVEVMTDKDMVVLLVSAETYDETPGRNGAELIPVNRYMIAELMAGVPTNWTPHRSPYVFSIAVQN